MTLPLGYVTERSKIISVEDGNIFLPGQLGTRRTRYEYNGRKRKRSLCHGNTHCQIDFFNKTLEDAKPVHSLLDVFFRYFLLLSTLFRRILITISLTILVVKRKFRFSYVTDILHNDREIPYYFYKLLSRDVHIKIREAENIFLNNLLFILISLKSHFVKSNLIFWCKYRKTRMSLSCVFVVIIMYLRR